MLSPWRFPLRPFKPRTCRHGRSSRRLLPPGQSQRKCAWEGSGYSQRRGRAEWPVCSTVVKYATGRERPNLDSFRGRFWQGGNSFPSGHATISWAIASVVSHEYPGPLTKLLVYGGHRQLRWPACEERSIFRLTPWSEAESAGQPAGKRIARTTIRKLGVAWPRLCPMLPWSRRIALPARWALLSFPSIAGFIRCSTARLPWA